MKWTLPSCSGMAVDWMRERMRCASVRVSFCMPITPSGASSDCSKLGTSGVGMK